jgi:hypothetical protein
MKKLLKWKCSLAVWNSVASCCTTRQIIVSHSVHNATLLQILLFIINWWWYYLKKFVSTCQIYNMSVIFLRIICFFASTLLLNIRQFSISLINLMDSIELLFYDIFVVRQIVIVIEYFGMEVQLPSKSSSGDDTSSGDDMLGTIVYTLLYIFNWIDYFNFKQWTYF